MNPPLASELSRKKERALRVGVITTFGSLIPTAYATCVSNSVILLTDLLRCSVEFCAILASWLILRRVLSSDTSKFNYGYGKLEQIASLAVAAAMLGTFLAVLISAISRFLEPQHVSNGFFGFILGLLSVSGNVTLWIAYRSLARQSVSPMMESQWRLFRAKTWASTIVVCSLLPSVFGSSSPILIYADPVGSLILSGFLLHSAIGLFSSSMHELLDSTLEEALQLSIIKTLVLCETDYNGLKQIRSRRSGGRIFVELFLEFDPKLSLADFESAAKKIRGHLLSSIPDSEITVIPSASA